MSASADIERALAEVRERSTAAAARSGLPPPRVVAVSKTKPVEALRAAYEAGQRDFGENYAQELMEKAPQLPTDIRWRFIGHLQSNKAKALVRAVPNLVAVETVDSAKLADRLEAAVAEASQDASPGGRALAVFLQVNTSGEESKFGVAPSEVVGLARHVLGSCTHLKLAGLMTIGQPDYSSRPENFTELSACRERVAEALGIPKASLELSMGMSGDYEQASEMGSTNIRVGSTIFGARHYPTRG